MVLSACANSLWMWRYCHIPLAVSANLTIYRTNSSVLQASLHGARTWWTAVIHWNNSRSTSRGVTYSRLIVLVEMSTMTHRRARWAHVYLIKLDSIWSVYNYPTPLNKLYYYYASLHGLYLFTSYHSNPKPAHRTLPNAGGLVLDRANWKMNPRLRFPLVPWCSHPSKVGDTWLVRWYQAILTAQA